MINGSLRYLGRQEGHERIRRQNTIPMHGMLMLVPEGQQPGFLLREIFLRQLPTDVRAHLAQSTNTSTKAVHTLASEADKFFVSMGLASETLPEDVNTIADRRKFRRIHAKYGAKAWNCVPPCAWKTSPKRPHPHILQDQD